MLPCGKLQRRTGRGICLRRRGKRADMLEAGGIVLENGRVNLKKYGINVEEMLAQRELEQN